MGGELRGSGGESGEGPRPTTEDLEKPAKEFEPYPEGKGEPVKGLREEPHGLLGSLERCLWLQVWKEERREGRLERTQVREEA